ncbi:MAG: hypothetical protein R6X02_25655 [Enhygromyxa sp.]
MDGRAVAEYAAAVSVSEIRQRLASNLARVERLISASDGFGSDAESDLIKSDMLRAAVVFLHATLEDLLRSGLELQLPRARPEQLGGILFVVEDDRGETRKREKLSLTELTQYRGQTVDDTIKDVVVKHLDRSNFNNIEEIGAATRRMGISGLRELGLDHHAEDLIALTSRRHWIVHRVDRNPRPSAEEPETREIRVSTVTVWKNCVEAVCAGILDALEQKS